MTNVMALRTQYKDVFEKRHGVKLGFMSFFTKAVVAALKEIPAVNDDVGDIEHRRDSRRVEREHHGCGK